MRTGKYAKRVGKTAPVYLAAVLEYLVAEIIDLSGNFAKEDKRQRITPKHVMFAVKTDEELTKLLKNVNISGAGVIPRIDPLLLSKHAKRKRALVKSVAE